MRLLFSEADFLSRIFRMPNILISIMRFLYKEKEAEGGGTGTEEVRSCSCVCHRPYEAHTHSLLICFSKHRLWKKKRYAETVIVNMRYLLVSNPAHAALIALFNSQQKIDIDVSASISFHCTMCPSSSVSVLKLLLCARSCQGWADVEVAIALGENFNHSLIKLKPDEVHIPAGL